MFNSKSFQGWKFFWLIHSKIFGQSFKCFLRARILMSWEAETIVNLIIYIDLIIKFEYFHYLQKYKFFKGTWKIWRPSWNFRQKFFKASMQHCLITRALQKNNRYFFKFFYRALLITPMQSKDAQFEYKQRQST